MKEKLKKNLLSITLIIVLGILQAILFLSIPKYILNTINYSNERKGITSYIPEIISTRSMNSFTAIMQNEDIKEYYELINKNDENYVKKYAVLNNQDTYVLNDIKKEDKKKLSELLLKAASLYTMFNQSEELKNMGFKPDATVINYYMGLPDDNEIKKIYSSYEELENSQKENYATSFVLEEYINLQFDLKSLQKKYLYKKGVIVLLIFVITLAIMIFTNYLSGKVINKLDNKYKSLIKNILNNGIFIPIILIESMINIVILNWKWLISIPIVIILLIFLYKYKLSIKESVLKKVILLIKPCVLLIITIIGIITMLTVPNNINNQLLIIYTLTTITSILLLMLLIISKNVKQNS